MPRTKNRHSDQLLRSRSRNAAEQKYTEDQRRSRQIRSWIILVALILAVLLNKLKNSLYKVEKIDISFENTIKRYGVYCFCIDDLPL